MTEEKPRLTADQCLAFARECESDAEREQDPRDKARLLKIAAVVRDLADTLRKTRLHLADG